MGLTHTKEEEKEFFNMRDKIREMTVELEEWKEYSKHYHAQHLKAQNELAEMTIERNNWKKRALKAESELVSMKILLDTAKTDLFIAKKQIDQHDELVRESKLKEADYLIQLSSLELSKRDERRIRKEQEAYIDYVKQKTYSLELDIKTAREIVGNRTIMLELATNEIENLKAVIHDIKKIID